MTLPEIDVHNTVKDCKLLINKTTVSVLNSIENLDWERLYIPIVPYKLNKTKVEIPVFIARLNLNRSSIPGEIITIDNIAYLEYYNTLKNINTSDIVNNNLHFSQSSENFIKQTKYPVTQPQYCSFVVKHNNGSRLNLKCTIPSIIKYIDICNNYDKKFFPINKTSNKNHLMSNPAFNIDHNFINYKYSFYRKFNDTEYGQCVNNEPIHKKCDKSIDNNKINLYQGNGICTEVSILNYKCKENAGLTNTLMVKINDNEFINCSNNPINIQKCEHNKIFVSNLLSHCISKFNAN